MTNGTFIGAKFQNVILDRVDLSKVDFHRSVFQNVSVANYSFFGVILKEAYFSHVNMTGCKGLISSQILSLSSPHQAILPDEKLFRDG